MQQPAPCPDACMQAARGPKPMPSPLWWDSRLLQSAYGGGSHAGLRRLLHKLAAGSAITVVALGSSVTEGHAGCWGTPEVPAQVEALPLVGDRMGGRVGGGASWGQGGQGMRAHALDDDDEGPYTGDLTGSCNMGEHRACVIQANPLVA